MKKQPLLLTPVLLLAPLAAPLHADLTLTAGLTYVQQGGTLGAGNIGAAGTAFALDLIAGGGYAPTHTIPNVNDSTFGNSNSWIGDTPASYVGVGFKAGVGPGSPQTIAGFAFGRDNTGTFGDRAAGTYTVQYTTSVDPATNHATATWNTIGTMSIASGSGVLTNAALRHQYNIDTPVVATGFRVLTPDGAAIDELELFSSAAPGGIGAIVTTANPGYSVSWDGNDGAHSSPGAVVPNNIALASNGGVAIASGALGPQLGIGYHIIPNLNDGLYGNVNSWIGGDGDPGPAHAGVMLSDVYEVTSIAFGRDNTATYGDRSQGTYTVQRTLDGSLWESIGSIAYNYNQDTGLGGGFTANLRHEFDLSDGSGGVLAKGIRLLVPGTGLNPGGSDIDELEIYGTLAVVPEPASAGLLALAAVFFSRRRRRA